MKDTAQAHLDNLSVPSVTTEVTALDVFLQTGESLDTPRLGALARVPIAELGISLLERVVRVTKTDIYNQPHKVKVILTSQTKDAARSTAALLRKSRIGELYSQGATSYQPIHFADNASASKPMTCKFYIDEQEHSINKVLCKFAFEAFRAYSEGAESGGGQTRTSTIDGGESLTSGPNNVSNTGIASGDTGQPSTNTSGSGGTGSTGTASADVVGVSGSADGSVGSHSHNSGSYTCSSHSHTGPSHTHSLSLHTHNLGAHTHSLNNHTHSVSTSSHSHSVTINPHSHGIVYGIYEGATAGSASIKVDGNVVDAGDIVDYQFDAVPYLAKDGDGKITRNTWHTITFTPDSMTRLVVDLFKQTFIRALSGGNY